jgi:hypothetical protein
MADHNNNMELVAMERVAMERVSTLMRLENDEALHAPNGRVNAPTADEFFDAYTPLMMNGSIEWDYVRDLTRFQIELVMNHYVRMARTNQVIPLRARMARFNPSIIAFAALMRADDFVHRMAVGIPDDDDDDDYDDESWVNRGDHDGLINDLGLDRALVQEAAVALENAIPNRVVRSYINWMDGGFQGDHPFRHLPNHGPNARVRPESPLQVDMFP